MGLGATSLGSSGKPREGSARELSPSSHPQSGRSSARVRRQGEAKRIAQDAQRADPLQGRERLRSCRFFLLSPPPSPCMSRTSWLLSGRSIPRRGKKRCFSTPAQKAISKLGGEFRNGTVHSARIRPERHNSRCFCQSIVELHVLSHRYTVRNQLLFACAMRHGSDL